MVRIETDLFLQQAPGRGITQPRAHLFYHPCTAAHRLQRRPVRPLRLCEAGPASGNILLPLLLIQASWVIVTYDIYLLHSYTLTVMKEQDRSRWHFLPALSLFRVSWWRKLKASLIKKNTPAKALQVILLFTYLYLELI